MKDGVEAGLNDIVEVRDQVAIGQVEAVTAHPSWGVLLDCIERPGGRRVQARQLRLGAGPNEGLNWPIAVNDEVVLLYPGGNPNRAVAIAGLPSRAAAVPSSEDGAHVDLVHPGGLSVRTSAVAAVEPVVLAPLLADFADFFAVFDVFLAACVADAALSPGVAAGATALQAAPPYTALRARLGAATYASGALKAQ